jgi:hypothetical protein
MSLIVTAQPFSTDGKKMNKRLRKKTEKRQFWGDKGGDAALITPKLPLYSQFSRMAE